MPEPNKQWWSLVVAFGWTLFILILTSVPGSDLPRTDLVSADKAGHFLLFAGFGYLWMHSLPLDVTPRFRLVLFAGLAFGVLTEIAQGVLPFGRHPDKWDAAANAAGVLIGAGLMRYRLWHASRRMRAVAATNRRSVQDREDKGERRGDVTAGSESDLGHRR